MGVVVLGVKKRNISLDPKVYEEFCTIAENKGIKVSTWINLKMKEFIEEEKEFEEMKKKKRLT